MKLVLALLVLLVPLSASAKGSKSKKAPKEEKPPAATIMDMSEPEGPSSPLPDIVKKDDKKK